MPLSRENQRKLFVWMEQYNRKACPVCGAEAWGGEIVIPQRATVYADGSIYLAERTGTQAPVVPLLLVGCMACGYSFLLSAKVLGIAGTEPP